MHQSCFHTGKFWCRKARKRIHRHLNKINLFIYLSIHLLISYLLLIYQQYFEKYIYKKRNIYLPFTVIRQTGRSLRPLIQFANKRKYGIAKNSILPTSTPLWNETNVLEPRQALTRVGSVRY